MLYKSEMMWSCPNQKNAAATKVAEAVDVCVYAYTFHTGK